MAEKTIDSRLEVLESSSVKRVPLFREEDGTKIGDDNIYVFDQKDKDGQTRKIIDITVTLDDVNIEAKRVGYKQFKFINTSYTPEANKRDTSLIDKTENFKFKVYGMLGKAVEVE